MPGSSRTALAALVCTLVPVSGLAAPPAEVGASLRFLEDRETLVWDGLPEAASYDVYRGERSDASDLACLVFRTAQTEAADAEVPTTLFTYVVGGWNADGPGPLGADRSPEVRCADDDGDGVRDDRDVCPGVADPLQRDHDEDGAGDPCDPTTYDFEADLLGERPAEVTRLGDPAPAFTVIDAAGDRGVAYDGLSTGVHDAFDRLRAPGSALSATAHVDLADAPGTWASVELWSEASWHERAGGGLLMRLDDDGRLLVRQRRGRDVTVLGDTTLPATGRLRLRLVKGAGTSSTLFVDRWDGGAWSESEAVIDVADDRLLRGRHVSAGDYEGGTRVLTRLSATATLPDAPLAVLDSPETVSAWKLFQRGVDDTAPIPIELAYRAAGPARLETRLVEAISEAPLPGFDWLDDPVELAPAPHGALAATTLVGVPAGGNYHLDVRVVDAVSEDVLGEQRIGELAVGDVFLAVGQSNMSGYSGVLEPAEEPIPEVHLFGNDYLWKRASEPMDSGVDQVDRVSEETPLHSLMLRFAKEIHAGAGVPVAVIPAPLGGTNLYAQWQRRADAPLDRGTLYGSSVHRVMVQGYAHAIRGVIWYQGESDVGRGTELYLQDLERLVADYRSDLGAADLAFGNVQLATYLQADLDEWLAIQEAQRRQAEADPRSVVVGTIDLSRSDSIHLSVDGYKTAAARLANAMLDELFAVPRPRAPELVSLRFGDASRTSIEIEYDRQVVGGGQPLLYRVRDGALPITIDTVTVAGRVVTLALQRPVSSSGTRVSYGYARNPSTAMIRAADGGGVALAFLDLSPE